MRNIDLNSSFSKSFLYILILVFPLSFLFRSGAINLNIILINLIILIHLISKKNVNLFKDDFIKFLLLFFLYIFVNSIIHFISIETILKSLGNFRYLLLSIGVYFVLNSISKKNKNTFVLFQSILIILIGLDIIFQYTFNQNLLGFYPGMCDENLMNCRRFSGVFNQELIAGGFLSQVGLLNFFLLHFIKFKDKKFAFTAITSFGLFLFIIILITGERNALLIYILTLFFHFYFIRKLILFIFLNFFLLLLIISLSQFSDSIKSRYLLAIDGWNVTNETKISKKIINSPWSYHYQAAFELFLKNPINGHGPRSFRFKCKETKIEKKLIEQDDYYLGYRSCSTHPHNYMMEFLSEHGVIGFLFFIILFFKLLFKLQRIKYKIYNENIYLTIGTGSLLLAIIFPFKPSGSFFSTFNASLFFYIFGYFLYYLRQIK